MNKIKMMEKFFDRIKALFPNNSISLMVHSVDFDKLPPYWMKEDVKKEDGSVYQSARRNLNTFDITLFSK